MLGKTSFTNAYREHDVEKKRFPVLRLGLDEE